MGLSYNASDEVAKPANPGAKCGEGDKIGNFTCVCKMTITHFTTFAVAETDESSGSTPSNSDKSKGMGAGAVIGIIIGVIAVVAIIAVLLVKRAQKQGPQSPKSSPDLDL